jgi:enterochelin esterase-like enzyme
VNTFKRTGLGSALLLLSADLAFSQPPQPAPAAGVQAAPGRGAQGPRVVSPEILPDNRVTFRLLAPKATEVIVNGDWPGGRGVQLTKDSSGVWSVTTPALSPEIWSYTFSVNGVKTLDPGNVHVIRDTTNYMSAVLVPGPASALYRTGRIPHGTVEAVWYPSPVLKTERRMMVYTPPGYEKSTARYPVLYLFHGGGGDEEAWTSLGVTNVVMDNLIAQGKTTPMIVVMPNANWNDTAALVSGGVRSTPAAGGAPVGQNYEQAEEEIVKGMIPFVETRYRALPGREKRAIAGLSMGGGIAINVGFNRLDAFASVGEFSSGMFGGVAGYAPYDIDRISPGFLKDSAATNRKLKVLYFSCGIDDPRMPFQTKAVEDLRNHGITLTFKSYPGAHEWRVWRSSLAEFAPMLFR